MNIYLKHWKGEIFRLEMAAVFVNLDRCHIQRRILSFFTEEHQIIMMFSLLS